MTALDVLKQCRDKGIILAADNGKLTADSPAGAMDNSLRNAIKASKEQLLELLNNPSEFPLPEILPAECAVPLSPYQEILWASQTSDTPDHSMLNLVGAFDLEEKTSSHRLEKAWNILIERHHALRTCFRTGNSGIAEQITAPAKHLKLQIAAVQSQEQHNTVLQEMAAEFQNTAYDLQDAQPIRIGLVQSPKKQTMVLGVHHIVADGWSVGVLLRELFSLLEKDDISESILPPLAFQHRDYVAWMLDTVMPKLNKNQSVFWQNKIKKMPPLHSLPTDYIRPEFREERTSRIPFILKKSEIDALQEVANISGTSMFMILHTCFRLALYRFGHELEPVMAVPSANRQTRTEQEALVGCFANKVLLHSKLDLNKSIAEAIDAGRRCLLEAMENQELPFARLLESQPRVQSWQPLSQIFFSYNKLDLLGLPVIPHPLPIAGVNNDLALTLWDVRGGVEGIFEYDTALFSHNSMGSFTDLFLSICRALPENLDKNPAELTLNTSNVSDDTASENAEALPEIKKTDTILFLKAKEAPLAKLLAARAGGLQAACKWADTLPEDITEYSIIVTALHPQDLREALESGKLKNMHTCFLNTLCHAHNLKWLQRCGAKVSLLLEYPEDQGKHIFINIEEMEELQGNECFIPVTFSKQIKGNHSGELVEYIPGLPGRFAENRQLLLPLPSPEYRTVWTEGKCLNLNTLARSLSSNMGINLVLGMMPAPTPGQLPTGHKTEQLIAWYTSEDDALPAGTGTIIPDHWVKVSSIPLTETGDVDFTILSRLPVLSKKALEKHPHATLVPAAHSLPMLHHSDAAKPGVHCPIEPQYTAMGMEMPVPESTQDFGRMSQVYGGDPDRDPQSFSFIQTIEDAADTEFIFIGQKGGQTSLPGSKVMEKAKQFLHGLQNNGMQHGDKLITYCPDQIDILPLFWASLLGGYCLTIFLPPVEGQAPEPVLQRLEYILESLDHPALVTTRDQKLPEKTGQVLFVEELPGDGKQAEIAPAAPDELIYMAFTSGSTGKPKAVPLMARNIASMLIGKSQWLGPLENETLLSMTSLDHVASLFAHCTLGILRKARLVLCPVQYILADPCRILDLTTEYRITRTWAPEFLWRQLRSSVDALDDSKKKWDLSSLTHVFSGGEPTREKTFERLEEVLLPFGMKRGVLANAWGMSETSSFYTIARPWLPGSGQVFASIVDAGGPIPGMSMRIVNAQGEVVPQGEIGSMQVAGPAVIRGYYNNPKANAKDFTEDGWFSTGDLALICDDKIILYGREKEILIIRGQNISQVEIEGAVEALPGVVPGFTAALGCRDAKTKVEEVLLFFSTDLHNAKEKAALVSRIQTVISQGFGVVPKHVIPVPTRDIPKSGLGKIQRAALIKRFLEGGFADAIRDVDLLVNNERTMPDWFATKRWVPENLHRSDNQTLDSWTMFLVGPDYALRTPLQQALEAKGATVVNTLTDESKFKTADPAHWTELLKDHSKEHKVGIICLIPDARDSSSCAAEQFEKWQASAISPVFDVTKHLGCKDIPEPDLLCAVTVNAQTVDMAKPCSPGASIVNGLLSAHRRQNINHRVLLLDTEGTDLTSEAEAIATEICEPTAHSTVALRNGKRYVPNLNSIDFAPVPANTEWEKPFRSDRFCVCTGGLGTVGSGLLPQILSSTNGRLLIIGRSPQQKGQSALKKLTKNIDTKRVLYAQADLADRDALDMALKKACNHFECKPGGILHMAADTSSHQIHELNFDKFSEATATTLRNLQNLEESFKSHHGVGPFINFSTVFAHWGERGFSVYGACSALKESFIHNMAIQGPGTGCNLSWSLFTSDTTSQESIMQSSFLAKRGFLSITPRQGFISMLGMLQSGLPAALIGLDRTNPGISADFHSKVSNAQAISLTSNSNFTPSYPLIHPLCPKLPNALTQKETGNKGNAEKSSSTSATEQRMAAVWKEVLNLEHLDVEANFFELGGSSVLLPRLRVKVDEIFGVDIGSTGIFQHASVREMALAIDGQIRPKQDRTDSSPADEKTDKRAAAQRAARQKRKKQAAK
ncbi:condensation domain-containing protein [Maridesulfovibrio sp.]|uniref:condensation domain-containing protein n=1 Tax=Maridesulfovibrio sp. TaxID=2795000 RepID=UPI003BAC2165